jgi:hypothetical protein
MTDQTDARLLQLNRPGVIVEVDAKTAEDLGAFVEEALTEAEALESAQGDPGTE